MQRFSQPLQLNCSESTLRQTCPAAMQNACMHPQQGAEGTAVRSSTFLFKNANQATNIVLEAQSYCTCSQSTMPAQLTTLKSTCQAKLAPVPLQLILPSPFAGTELLVWLTEGKVIPSTGKGNPLLLPQQRLQAPSWTSPFQPLCVTGEERREK